MAELDWIFFDLGGVLYRLDFQAVWDDFTEACGRSVEKIKEALYEECRFKGFESGRITGYEYYRGVMGRLGTCMDFDGFVNAWNRIMVRDEAMFELAARLKRTVKLLIISNTNALNARCIEKDTRDLTDLAVYSFEIGVMKPHRRIFRKALRVSSARKKRILYVDDREENIEAAERMGIPSVLFRNQRGFEEVLLSHGIMP